MATILFDGNHSTSGQRTMPQKNNAFSAERTPSCKLYFMEIHLGDCQEQYEQ